MSRSSEIVHLLYLLAFRPALAVAAVLGIILIVSLLAAQAVATIFAVAFSLLVLLYASYRDLKERTVSNKVWLLMLVVGFAFLLHHALSSGAPYLGRALLSALWSLGVTALLGYLFFRLHLIGGADAKSLLSLALLFPSHPQFTILSWQFPVYGGLPEALPPAMLIIMYGLLLALSVPIFLLLRNFWRLGVRAAPGNQNRAFYKLPLVFLASIFLLLRNLRESGTRLMLSDLGMAFLGYRVPVGQLAERRHVKLLHVYEESNGSLHRRFRPGGVPLDEPTLERLRRYHQQGQIPGEVWVTPELPFLVFITGGFVLATFLGGLFWG